MKSRFLVLHQLEAGPAVLKVQTRVLTGESELSGPGGFGGRAPRGRVRKSPGREEHGRREKPPSLEVGRPLRAGLTRLQPLHFNRIAILTNSLFSWDFHYPELINLIANGNRCGKAGAEHLRAQTARLPAFVETSHLRRRVSTLQSQPERAAPTGNSGPGSILGFPCPSWFH